MNHVLLFDANNVIMTNLHAHKGLSVDDVSTGGVFGAINTTRRILLSEFTDVSRVVYVFDAGRPAFRTQHCPTYKEGRKTDDDIYRMYKENLGIIREFLPLMGVHSVESEGFEADDVIGSLCDVYRSKGSRVTIVSGDKDLFQLVRKDVQVFKPISHDVIRKIPRGYVLRRCLQGDPSDRIPGVGGIGEVRANALVDSLCKTNHKPTPKGLIDAIMSDALDQDGAKWGAKAILGKDKADCENRCRILLANWKVMNLKFTREDAIKNMKHTKGKLDKLSFFGLCKKWKFKSILSEQAMFAVPFGSLT